MKSLVFLGIMLAVVYVAVFLFPGHVNKLALVKSAVEQGQFWRFFTHPFSHLSLTHLITNLLAFTIAIVLAVELKTRFKNFSVNYFLAGFLAILPLWFLLKFTILGASAAIYAGFGLVSLDAPKYKIKAWIVLGVFLALIFTKSAVTYLSLGFGGQFVVDIEQALSHFSGLGFGIMMFFLFAKMDKVSLEKKSCTLRRCHEKS